MFKKVLIANRGEIAIRVARTLKEMGIGSVAVYSEIDRDAPHVREADEAFLIGPALPAESYLNIVKDRRHGQARPAPRRFTPATGSSPRTPTSPGPARRRGSSSSGRRRRRSRRWGQRRGRGRSWPRPGCRSCPGRRRPPKDVEEARQQAEEAGYPVAAKAAGGGGGKGFRVAMSAGRPGGGLRGRRPRGREVLLRRPRLRRALPGGSAPRRGPGAGRLPRQRDPPGRARLLGPAPPPEGDRGGAGARTSTPRCASGSARSPPTRRRRSVIARAGTVEGLQVGEEYFFLEMNTRVQVEHCVTEMVSGVDIVREQVRVAAGEPLSVAQEGVELRGHAIECRINAEAAAQEFRAGAGRDHDLPRAGRPGSPGRLRRRQAGSEVTPDV